MKEYDLAVYLAPTDFLNFNAPEILDFTAKAIGDATTPTAKAVRLYYAVRDGWRYNPYRISLRRADWQATEIFKKPDGHCQDKSILLATCARAAGIPSRLHLAKVKNHIAVEQLTEKFGTNELTPHGYTELYLDGKWVKATPAFNRQLCERLNVSPLDFDGKTDSFFQEYDKSGGIFMEYLEDYGTFADVPLDFMIDIMRTNYPKFAHLATSETVIDFS